MTNNTITAIDRDRERLVTLDREFDIAREDAAKRLKEVPENAPRTVLLEAVETSIDMFALFHTVLSGNTFETAAGLYAAGLMRQSAEVLAAAYTESAHLLRTVPDDTPISDQYRTLMQQALEMYKVFEFALEFLDNMQMGIETVALCEGSPTVDVALKMLGASSAQL